MGDLDTVVKAINAVIDEAESSHEWALLNEYYEHAFGWRSRVAAMGELAHALLLPDVFTRAEQVLDRLIRNREGVVTG